MGNSLLRRSHAYNDNATAVSRDMEASRLAQPIMLYFSRGSDAGMLDMATEQMNLSRGCASSVTCINYCYVCAPGRRKRHIPRADSDAEGCAQVSPKCAALSVLMSYLLFLLCLI